MDLDGLAASPEPVFDEEREVTEVLTDEAAEAVFVDPPSAPESMAAHGRVRPFAAPPAIKALLAVIREALLDGESVNLPGLGSFTVQAHPARTGRNPRTGEIIVIPAGARVHFKNANGLRQRINPGD